MAAVQPAQLPQAKREIIFDGDAVSRANQNLTAGKRFSDYDALAFTLYLNFCDLNGSWIGKDYYSAYLLRAAQWEVTGRFAVAGGEIGRFWVSRVGDSTFRPDRNGCASGTVKRIRRHQTPLKQTLNAP